MESTAGCRTLCEDWEARREHLGRGPRQAGDFHAVEIRVLDFLLRRYRDLPEAARPARFPLDTGVYVNHRAMVVLRHLGGGWIPTITSQREAEARVRSIVSRMLGQQGAGPRPRVTFGRSGREDRRAELLRMALCDRDPTVRVQMAEYLGCVGDLDDIGLLADLLSLPPSDDEHPDERRVLAEAMETLAGMRSPTGLPSWKCPACGADVPACDEQCGACGNSLEDQVLQWLAGP